MGNAWPWPGRRRAAEVGAVFDVKTGEEAFALSGAQLLHESTVPGGVLESGRPTRRREQRGRRARVGCRNGDRPVHAARSQRIRPRRRLEPRLVSPGHGRLRRHREGVGDRHDGVRERWSLSAQETKSGIVGVAFSPDGTRVMAGDAGNSAVKVWDLGPTGDAEWANLPAPGYPAAEFMPDGRRVVTSSWAHRLDRLGAGAVTIWDLQAGRDLRTIGPPADYFAFTSFAVSPDGSSIALGGDSNPKGCRRGLGGKGVGYLHRRGALADRHTAAPSTRSPSARMASMWPRRTGRESRRSSTAPVG